MKLSVIGLRGFPMVEGGVEKHCESLYPRLDKDIEITVYRRRPYATSKGNYKRISFVDLPSTKIKGFEPFFHSLISSVSALIKKPDVVHYHNIGPALFSPIVKLRRIPVVLTYHSPNYEHDKWGFFSRKLLRYAEGVALRTADRVIFVNKFQMEKYKDNIRKKSVYLPNGINNMPIDPNTDYLEEIGIKPGKYILSVGRITKEKGFDTLIKAYKQAERNGFKLVIAGGVEFESSYMNELKELATNEDIIFTGYTYGEKLYQLYTHAGLYILASRNEGFPLVLLEAMRYGLDVLVSDIPATHLVNLEKEDYFQCENTEELSCKMSKKMKHIRRRDYDLTEYDWDKIARDVSNLLREIVEDR